MKGLIVHRDSLDCGTFHQFSSILLSPGFILGKKGRKIALSYDKSRVEKEQNGGIGNFLKRVSIAECRRDRKTLGPGGGPCGASGE